MRHQKPGWPCGLAVLLFLLCSGVMSAEMELEPMTVTAAPVASRTDQATRAVTVMEREQIEASGASSLHELLAQIPGVLLRRRGVGGAQADVSVAGSHFEQTLVLINGVAVSSPQTGHLSLDLPLPLAAIERIEVVKGPGGVQHGGRVTGGVINLITRSPRQSETRIDAALGSHASRSIEAQMARSGPQLGTLTAGAFRRVHAERIEQPDDLEARQLFHTGQALLGTVDLDWGAGASHRDFGAWGFYSDVYPDARERITSALTWLGASWQTGEWAFRSTVNQVFRDDRFTTFIAGTPYENHHRVRQSALEGSARRADASGTTVIGLMGQRDHIRSNALGERERDLSSLWLFRQQDLGPLRMEAGLNHMRYDSEGSHWLPSLGLSWALNDHWTLHAAMARSARLPSFTELYMSSAANRGNPALGLERSQQEELGLRGQIHAHQFNLLAYDRLTRDYIDFRRPESQDYWQAENLGRLNSRGAEASWRWQVGGRWLEALGLSLHVAHNRMSQEGAKNLRYFPDHIWQGEMRWRLGADLKLALQARLPHYRNQADAVLADLRLSWSRQRLQLWLQADNLFDERIIEAGFAPIPGRRLYLGASQSF